MDELERIAIIEDLRQIAREDMARLRAELIAVAEREHEGREIAETQLKEARAQLLGKDSTDTDREDDLRDWEIRLRADFLVAREGGYLIACRYCPSIFELSDQLGPVHQLRRALAHAEQHAKG